MPFSTEWGLANPLASNETKFDKSLLRNYSVDAKYNDLYLITTLFYSVKDGTMIYNSPSDYETSS